MLKTVQPAAFDSVGRDTAELPELAEPVGPAVRQPEPVGPAVLVEPVVRQLGLAGQVGQAGTRAEPVAALAEPTVSVESVAGRIGLADRLVAARQDVPAADSTVGPSGHRLTQNPAPRLAYNDHS